MAGPNGELDWMKVDEEFDNYSEEMLESADTLAFGRKTYQLMESYWPGNKEGSDHVTGLMNSLHKVVFTKTLKTTDWNNVDILSGEIGGEVKRLKEKDGRGIALLGSGEIVTALTKLKLVDEYRLILSPVVLGKGKPLFPGMDEPVDLQLVHTRTFKSGKMILTYHPL